MDDPNSSSRQAKNRQGDGVAHGARTHLGNSLQEPELRAGRVPKGVARVSPDHGALRRASNRIRLSEGLTKWQFINSVTQWIDHERGRDPGSRLNSAWFGPGEALKRKA